MRNPKIVLDNLTVQAKKADCYFERLYRNLYNIDFFLEAYGKIYAKEGNMTSGTDGKTIDGMGEERLNRLIDSLRNQTYQPAPAKRTYIPKKNSDKLRPLGIPSIEDKIVQEIVRSILESIYEVDFSDFSHGFRPNRSCHTAIAQIMRNNGIAWFIEGDIEGFFDNIDHHVLINILRKKIKDEKFINLIWKFLKAGYMENWQFYKTYSGTPQGGIVSPILANIYLNEFDKYIEKYILEFNKGVRRQRTQRARQLEFQIAKRKKALEKNIYFINNESKEMDEETKSQLLREISDLKKERTKVPNADPMDSNFKRLTYTRYADDFLIGVIGSKQDSIEIKKDISEYLKTELKLNLSQEKTLITHGNDFARFLGYDITICKSQKTKKVKLKTKLPHETSKVRTEFGKVKLYVPHEVWVNKLKQYDALEIIMVDGKEKWIPCHRGYMRNNDDLEIVSKYNAEIRGLYNYYKLANNVSVLNKFYFIMRYSFAKTLAMKYNTSVSKIMGRFKVDGKLAIRYNTKKGSQMSFFYKDGFQRNITTIKKPELDEYPNLAIFDGRNGLIKRLMAHSCEWCGKENIETEVHHVRKLKDLKGKARWEKQMIARKRKTMVLCKECHLKLHKGLLD